MGGCSGNLRLRSANSNQGALFLLSFPDPIIWGVGWKDALA